MQLQLTFASENDLPLRAAYIQGASPKMWLNQLWQWNVSLEQITCYVVPESIRSVKPSGLLVLFSDNCLPKVESIQFPYGCLSDKLYIPFYSKLNPSIDEKELQSMLLYDCHFFHPTIGMVGFETSDRVVWEELLLAKDSVESEWTFAQNGQAAQLPLRQISIEKIPDKELLDSFKEEVNSKPLEDLLKKKKDESGRLKNIIDSFFAAILKVASTILAALIHFIVFIFKPTPSAHTQPGILNQLHDWMNKKIEDLENSRDKELKRLMKMFEENMDEALQYAIPLDSPYLDRGKASTPSGKLSRNDGQFSLNKLGGGGAVDGWDVNKYYNDLRRNYQNAANKEIANQNFKKAAYIYAHLLGDYKSAANVLKQGKYFRESATLYKEHLKDLPAAAECLENGGLYLEAIECYSELRKHEKVGDLYTAIEQQTEAEKHYRTSIDLSLDSRDYIEASRITQQKLKNTSEAKEILLNGWTDVTQPEICLDRYFDITAEYQKDKLGHEIKKVYSDKTSFEKQSSFLNVLGRLIGKYKEDEIKESSREIAYEIVSTQVEKGNTTSLHMLKQFEDKDRLLGADCNRFISLKAKKASEKNISDAEVAKGEPFVQLLNDKKWQSAVNYHNQILIVGTHKNDLYLVRLNWEKQIEYYSWNCVVKQEFNFDFPLLLDFQNEKLFINSYYPINLEERLLSESSHFQNKLVTDSLNWLPAKTIGYTVDSNMGIAVLQLHTSNLTLSHYSAKGDLIQQKDCNSPQEAISFDPRTKMYRRGGHYYIGCGFSLLRISEDGTVYKIDLPAEIYKLEISDLSTSFRLLVVTRAGCFLFRPELWQIKECSPLFAEDIEVKNAKFMVENAVVITSDHFAIVYDIQHDTPKILMECKTNSKIVSILSTSQRNQFALLEEEGTISTFNIDTSV